MNKMERDLLLGMIRRPPSTPAWPFLIPVAVIGSVAAMNIIKVMASGYQSRDNDGRS